MSILTEIWITSSSIFSREVRLRAWISVRSFLRCSRSITKIIICFDSCLVLLISIEWIFDFQNFPFDFSNDFLISKISPFDFPNDFLISKISPFDFSNYFFDFQNFSVWFLEWYFDFQNLSVWFLDWLFDFQNLSVWSPEWFFDFQNLFVWFLQSFFDFQSLFVHESKWVRGLHGLLVWFWRSPRMIAFQLDFFTCAESNTNFSRLEWVRSADLI